MSVIGQGNPGQPVSWEPEQTFVTLEPIRTDGLDAIDPNGIPEIKATPFPSTGTITAAVFFIEFSDSPEPRRVIVCLPDTVLLERPSDAPIVFRWLDKCRLRLPRKLAQILLALSLSLSAATASPLLDDDTDDPDDDHPETQVLAFGL